ncbi:hypothetical protein M9458_024728, partial [Cirrhinus mrigala]
KPSTAPAKLEFSDCGKTQASMIAPRIFGGKKFHFRSVLRALIHPSATAVEEHLLTPAG